MKISARSLQYTFFVLFVLSVLVGFMLMRFQVSMVTQASELTLENGQPSVSDFEELLAKRAAGFDASVISMIATLAGFIVSTVMRVRKDRREASEAALVMQQKTLELEKLRMELDALKKKMEGE